MTLFRRLTVGLAAACAALALTAAPSMAIVGGKDAAPGAYPAVAEITFGQSFLCTGTLIAPTWVLTAGHCGSITGAAVGTPAGWPPQLIDVRIGSVKPGQGEKVPVQRVVVEPNYLVNSGYDITLLKLATPSTKAPAKVVGAGGASLWAPCTLETIVGFGTTSEGGDTPDTLQEAQVPITTDAYCAGAYSDFDPQTMLCAGFPQGGVDTCQGDSGGPMFGRDAAGTLKVVGATSFGEGCAPPEQAGRLRPRRRQRAARVDPLTGPGRGGLTHVRLVRIAPGSRTRAPGASTPGAGCVERSGGGRASVPSRRGRSPVARRGRHPCPRVLPAAPARRREEHAVRAVPARRIGIGVVRRDRTGAVVDDGDPSGALDRHEAEPPGP